MVDDRYVVEHAHEIQGTGKETRAFPLRVALQVCGWWYHRQVTISLMGFCHYSKMQDTRV
jgi:hypothetical protein